jgi:hypothetical protein
MGIAGAAFGASNALEDIVAKRILQQKLEQEVAERQRRFELDEQRMRSADEHNAWERSRTERLDREESEARVAAGDRQAKADRGRSNMAGVIGMGLDPQTAKREIAFSSLNSGASVPSGVMEALTPERDPIAEYRQRKEIDEEFEDPPTAARPQVFQVNGKLVDANGKVVYDGGGNGQGGPSPYASERNARTSSAVDDIIGEVSGWTAGYGGLLSNLPQTGARQLRGKLDTLRANIAFNELAAMREASKTGGALGSVAVRELDLLQNSLGNLDQLQDPTALVAELTKIKESAERWRQAAGGEAKAAPMQPVNSRGGSAIPGATPAAGAGPRRMRFDKTGKPIP